MFDKLDQLMGQDSGKQDGYRDFERRSREDPDGISEEEAARRYREMMANTDDDLNDPEADAEYERAFSRMSESERRQLARRYQDASSGSSSPFDGFGGGLDLDRAASPRELGRMTRQASQQDPNLLTSLLGPGSPLSGPAGRMALSTLASFAARRFLSRR